MALSLSPPNSPCFYTRSNPTLSRFSLEKLRFSHHNRQAISTRKMSTPTDASKQNEKNLSRRSKEPSPKAQEKQRVITIGGRIFKQRSDHLVSSLLFMDEADSSKDLYIFIISVGGEITPTLAIYDTMQFMKSPIKTRCMGYAFDLSGLLLAAGNKGDRTSLSYARITLRPLVGEAHGPADHVMNESNQLSRIRDHICKQFAKHTGQSEQKIFDDLNVAGGKRFTAQEAIEYGLIDRIVTPFEINKGRSKAKTGTSNQGLG